MIAVSCIAIVALVAVVVVALLDARRRDDRLAAERRSVDVERREAARRVDESIDRLMYAFGKPWSFPDEGPDDDRGDPLDVPEPVVAAPQGPLLQEYRARQRHERVREPGEL